MNYHKLFSRYILAFVLLVCLNACKKDNYAPPNLTFSGRVTYQGTPLGLKNNGGGTVYFELWQSGFGSSGAIQVFFNQDGSFSSQLFSGNYKMVIPVSQGPFMSIPDKTTNSDTTLLTLSSNKTMDIEVLPYYMFSNSSFKLNADSTVQASCSISQIITDANAKSIEYVALFVNRTSFVDDDNQIAQAKIKGSDLTGLVNISFTTKIPTNIANGNVGVPNQNYFFARIGLKISGKDDMLFTDVQKLTF